MDSGHWNSSFLQHPTMTWKKARINTGETPPFVLLSLPPFPCEKTLFLLPGLVRFPPLPLPKPGNRHLQACIARTLERCLMLKPPGAVLSNCKQLPAWVHRSCLFSSMGRTPCFDQIFLGQSFIYQPKTEPKQQSVASLQLLPRALLFHLCVWGY